MIGKKSEKGLKKIEIRRSIKLYGEFASWAGQKGVS